MNHIKQSREARLAQQLRANLLKRKMQARLKNQTEIKKEDIKEAGIEETSDAKTPIQK